MSHHSMNENIATLTLYVPSNEPELIEVYSYYIDKHNASVESDAFANSGFDLFVPESTTFEDAFITKYLNMKVKGVMTYKGAPSAFLLHPRSSISKTPLILANCTGIIDSGYRGDLIGAFRCFQPPYTVDKHNRLLQICHPTMCPIRVKMLHDENQLCATARGSGGFGSTGK